MTFTHLDLFAGIGGFSRAVGWAGGTTIGFVEWDSWCRRVLAKHWPEAHFHGDIKTLTAATLRDWGIRTSTNGDTHTEGEHGRRQSSRVEAEHAVTSSAGSARPVDLITGGYPCQPFSLAGQRLGAEDDRHLWPEMRRVIDLCRPRFVLAENVAGHVTMGLDTVLSDLEADGYTCGAVVIPACAVNALHRRDRVWIMAHRSGEGCRSGGVRGGTEATGTLQHEHATNGGQTEPNGMAHAEGRPRVPATHGQPELREWDARLEHIGSGTGLDQRGTQPGMADAQGVSHRSANLETHAFTDGGQSRPLPPSRGDALSRDSGPAITRQVARSVDVGPDGLPAGLVRRPATGPAEPDLIRQAWADGSWESDLPRVVAEEPERRQKLQAAGNAIVPILAYEVLCAMIGADDGPA